MGYPVVDGTPVGPELVEFATRAAAECPRRAVHLERVAAGTDGAPPGPDSGADRTGGGEGSVEQVTGDVGLDAGIGRSAEQPGVAPSHPRQLTGPGEQRRQVTTADQRRVRIAGVPMTRTGGASVGWVSETAAAVRRVTHPPRL